MKVMKWQNVITIRSHITISFETKKINFYIATVVDDLGPGGTFFAFYGEIVPGGSIIFFFFTRPW